jgi:hypothetical protein
MRALVKRFLEAIPVPLAIKIEAAKRAVAPAEGHRRIRQIMTLLGNPDAVLAGPFKGMKYISEAVGSAFLPKIVGTYEYELHGLIDEYLRGDFDRFVDFGAAEGYYAIGFALKMPALKVVTFDISKRARWLQGDLARRNGVAGRLDIRGEGDPSSLNAALDGARKALVVCDCEGYEDALLKPDLAPNLKRATILIEMHDHVVPGVTERVKERFASTHTLREIATSQRIPSELLTNVPAEHHEAFSEGRKFPQVWLALDPRA